MSRLVVVERFDLSLAEAMSKAGASITRDFEVWPKKVAGPLPDIAKQLDQTSGEARS